MVRGELPIKNDITKMSKSELIQALKLAINELNFIEHSNRLINEEKAKEIKGLGGVAVLLGIIFYCTIVMLMIFLLHLINLNPFSENNNISDLSFSVMPYFVVQLLFFVIPIFVSVMLVKYINNAIRNPKQINHEQK